MTSSKENPQTVSAECYITWKPFIFITQFSPGLLFLRNSCFTSNHPTSQLKAGSEETLYLLPTDSLGWLLVALKPCVPPLVMWHNTDSVCNSEFSSPATIFKHDWFQQPVAADLACASWWKHKRRDSDSKKSRSWSCAAPNIKQKVMQICFGTSATFV